MSEAAFRAVSADSHVNPPADMWREYLPAEFRDRAPTVERTDEGDFEVFEGRRRPMMALAAAAGRRPEEYTMSVRRFDEVRPGGWEPGPRVEDQDIDGVDAEILFGAAVGAPLPSGDPDLARAGFSAYNRWLADFCSYAPDRLIGMAYLPLDDPEVAIAEARDAASRGLRGAVLAHQPPTGDWAAEEWASLWRTIVELGWPAHFHVGGSANIGAVSQVRGAFLNGLVASKFNLPLSLGAMVLSGVLAEHPDLKLVSVEGQIGWIPFWKYYLDHVYEKHRWHQNVHLDELPSTYIERQMWFTFMEDPPGIDARHACGVDRIMWSNDYPHSETTWPHSQKIIGDIFERVPADEVQKIVRDNCVALYGL
ncbi:MAG: amidohydrolase family protein [Acidimicrobiia bacterium]